MQDVGSEFLVGDVESGPAAQIGEVGVRAVAWRRGILFYEAV